MNRSNSRIRTLWWWWWHQAADGRGEGQGKEPQAAGALARQANVKRSGAISMGMTAQQRRDPRHATPEQYTKEITVATTASSTRRRVCLCGQQLSR